MPIPLNDELAKEFNTALYHVWNSIGPDIMESLQACGESIDNEQAIESCLDADQLMYNGHPDLNDKLKLLCKEHGWDKVVKFFAKHNRFA